MQTKDKKQKNKINKNKIIINLLSSSKTTKILNKKLF